tara:strand:- start:7 stop:675 length:669 start_codon:yes stop_codon:yes gene_type:complete
VLKHFQPLDLGSSAATEYQAKNLAKILKKTLGDMPELGKCMMGLIHSHHNMSAYHSGTDDDTLKEMAPVKGFYGSLVVSHDNDYAFEFSYKDQYGFPRCSEVDDIIYQEPIIKKAAIWVKEANAIEKASKKAATVMAKTGNGTQQGIWGGHHYDRFNYGYDSRALADGMSRHLTWADMQYIDDAHDEYETGKIKKGTFDRIMKEYGIDPAKYFLGVPSGPAK